MSEIIVFFPIFLFHLISLPLLSLMLLLSPILSSSLLSFSLSLPSFPPSFISLLSSYVPLLSFHFNFLYPLFLSFPFPLDLLFFFPLTPSLLSTSLLSLNQNLPPSHPLTPGFSSHRCLPLPLPDHAGSGRHPSVLSRAGGRAASQEGRHRSLESGKLLLLLRDCP